MKRYRVDIVLLEKCDLASGVRPGLAPPCRSFLYWKVGCGFPFGGLVSAVWYANKVRGDWYHLSAHLLMASASASDFWLLMVFGSLIRGSGCVFIPILIF